MLGVPLIVIVWNLEERKLDDYELVWCNDHGDQQVIKVRGRRGVAVPLTPKKIECKTLDWTQQPA